MSLPSADLRARKRHVFASVFGPDNNSQYAPIQYSDPTYSTDRSEHYPQQIEWDASWHLVTQTLRLPRFLDDGLLVVGFKPKGELIDPQFQNALQVLLFPRDIVPLAVETGDIVTWHSSQVRRHFLGQVLPVILQLQNQLSPESVLLRSIEILEVSNHQYRYGLSLITEQIELFSPGASLPIISKFCRDLNAVICNTVMDVFSDALTIVLRRYVSIILGLPVQRGGEDYSIRAEGLESEKALQAFLGLVNTFKKLGLAGEGFQVIFAEIMNNAMSEYINQGCKSTFTASLLAPVPISQHETTSSINNRHSNVCETSSYPSRCVKDICEWVENRYAKLVVQILSLLDDKINVSWTEKEKFKEMSISRLAELRIKELFRVVESWPHGGGALDDLRTAITTPQRRLYLTDIFAQVLAKKVLHPAASTTRILQTYISMIWSFHSLDHSKVLLDRVAYPLQLYLCTREDTVRIIIINLLADTDADHNSGMGEKLGELARLLNDEPCLAGSRVSDEELDWHDMDWLPDPVDAGPGYKRSKSADVIGTLVGVLGSQEVFIKEFQNIIGENFLKYDGAFSKEIKVLELLKVRFGEAPLQACEVMLKDIQDSGKVDVLIRRKQKLNPSKREIQVAENSPARHAKVDPEGLFKTSLHAKILSRLFWPQLPAESYRVPEEVAELQRKYETGFEELKLARKLTWLHTLGQATVHLELEDRSLVEEVHTWQAAVIWAFQGDNPGDTGTTRTVQELIEVLEMEEALIRSALRFWIKKLVLHELSVDTYAVSETINQEDRARSDALTTLSTLADESEPNADDRSLGVNTGIGKEKMGIYWQFIIGMLTNSSSQMPLHQIGMMLRMLIIDGFPHSNDELRDLLGQKIADGELELVGGKYQLKK